MFVNDTIQSITEWYSFSFTYGKDQPSFNDEIRTKDRKQS